jgi:phosphate transport system permease protein
MPAGMHATPSFTGRARRRATRPWVRASDSLARLLITFGGIGTIVAVLLVGVFLLAVALPLFRPARARLDGVAAVPFAASVPAAVALDESAAVAVAIALPRRDDDADADDGGVTLMSVADGVVLARTPAAECGLAGATAIRIVPGTRMAAVGCADGSLRTGQIGMESTFIDAAALPAEAHELRRGAAVVTPGGVVARADNGRYARVAVVTELAAATRSLVKPIVDIDVTAASGGPLVAALDEAGRVRVESVTSRRNLLTDEVVTSAVGSTIEPIEGFTPRFVRVSELGDQLFLFAADGAARRYVIRDVEAPVEMETFDAAPGEPGVTAVERLFGGSSFAVADSAGRVRVFFTARTEQAAADGLAVVAAHDFATAGPVTALAASPRSRLFAAATADGRVRLLQATRAATVLDLPAATQAAGQAATRLCLAPRENRLLGVGPAGMASWSIEAGYPEVSFATLLRPVWYENYPQPVHAWETTGHEAFESKFGFIPLVFGTVKATLYAMVFATPIAILAAIYASQFLHARWRARIKPTIELMAGLPSVVLGFIAGLVFAPLIERAVMPVITGLFTVPLALLIGALLWQLMPSGSRSRLAAWRFLPVACLALPAGVFAARGAAPVVERMLFAGDFRGWLDGQGGSGFGGWMLALVPLAAVVMAAVTGRFVQPWLRRAGARWSDRQAGAASLLVFLGGAVAAVALAAAAAVFLDALRIDTRGGLFGTYVQRNALVVGLGMSFAIIPLIFTIADDALMSVPDHLRSASLGAGATPWQTAVRVIVPAAASGLFSAVMIGLGRAVGETMIVLMAAGNTPIIDWNLFNGFQTLSAAIATELPEAARGSAHYRVLFLAALALFVLTFIVNTAAELVRQRFRRRAHEL